MCFSVRSEYGGRRRDHDPPGGQGSASFSSCPSCLPTGATSPLVLTAATTHLSFRSKNSATSLCPSHHFSSAILTWPCGPSLHHRHLRGRSPASGHCRGRPRSTCPTSRTEEQMSFARQLQADFTHRGRRQQQQQQRSRRPWGRSQRQLCSQRTCPWWTAYGNPSQATVLRADLLEATMVRAALLTPVLPPAVSLQPSLLPLAQPDTALRQPV